MELLNTTPEQFDALHRQIRRIHCAQRDLDYWSKAYAGDPTDYHATRYHGAWIELRAAVDAMVAAPQLHVDSIAIATQVWTQATPEGT